MGNACARPGQQDQVDLEALKTKPRTMSANTRELGGNMHQQDDIHNGGGMYKHSKPALERKQSTVKRTKSMNKTQGYVQNTTGLNISDEKAKAAFTNKRRQSTIAIQNMAQDAILNPQVLEKKKKKRKEVKAELAKTKEIVKLTQDIAGKSISQQQFEQKQSIKKALQLGLYLKMTKDVQAKTGWAISTELALGHKDIKEELKSKQKEIQMSRLTGNNLQKETLKNHQSIKDELKKTEVKRRMSRMAGANLTMDQINYKKNMKDEIEKAQINNKVNAMSESKVPDDMVAKKFAIKAALQDAIRQKMIMNTKKFTGNQTLHKAQIEEKLTLKDDLVKAERERKQQAKKIQKKEILPNSLQQSIQDQLEKKKVQEKFSTLAGTQVNQDQIKAKSNIKEALKEALLQKTINAMQDQIDIENKDSMPNSLQQSIKDQLQKKKAQRRLSMWAGTTVGLDQMEAKEKIKVALKEAELQKTIKAIQQQIDIENKAAMPDSLQKSVKEQLEKKKTQRRLSMWAGTQVNQDQIQAKENIKEALKEAELQKTIQAMQAQIDLENKENQVN